MVHPRRTNNWNHLNNRTRSNLSIYCNPIPTPTVLNRRNPQSSNNTKNSRTPMILKLWILRLYETRIWFIYSTTRRPSNQYILTTRYRQPNCTTYKLADSNNRKSSRCATLMNSAESWGRLVLFPQELTEWDLTSQAFDWNFMSAGLPSFIMYICGSSEGSHPQLRVNFPLEKCNLKKWDIFSYLKIKSN